MGDTDKPKIEELGEELTLWNTYREIRRAKGIDPGQLLKEWAADLEQSLTSPGAREEFAELCLDGCLPQGLAVVVTLLRYSPLLGRFWTDLIGQPDNRDKASRALENAAQTLEGLFGDVIALENEGKGEQLSRIGRVPISGVVSELRFHIRFINLARSLGADTETRSPTELAKYLLTSYVRQMTGRFHDRSVSGLIGEIVGSPNYDEVAQRMWRARNYERIDKHHSGITRFLVAMSVVIAHTT